MAILRGIKLSSALGALALFFLPWIDIQCSGKSVATQTGLQAIVGQATLAEERQTERGSLHRQEPESLGSARLVAGGLIVLVFAVLLLLLAVAGHHPLAEGIGSLLCALALALLITQVIEGFPVKDALVQDVSVDNASLEMDFEASTAMAVMTSFEVKVLPAFIATCALLGIAVLLGAHQALNRLRK